MLGGSISVHLAASPDPRFRDFLVFGVLRCQSGIHNLLFPSNRANGPPVNVQKVKNSLFDPFGLLAVLGRSGIFRLRYTRILARLAVLDGNFRALVEITSFTMTDLASLGQILPDS